jgi:hypothetical protein
VHRADAAAREQLGRLIAAAPQRQEAETVRTT